jgi:hypothetical protein
VAHAFRRAFHVAVHLLGEMTTLQAAISLLAYRALNFIAAFE